MAPKHAPMTISVPLDLLNAFDKLAPSRKKSTIITQLIREWMRAEVGFAALDTQVELARAKVDELKKPVELFHEAQADLERLTALQSTDADLVRANEDRIADEVAEMELRNDIEDLHVKQKSDRAWLGLVGTEEGRWPDGTPGYVLYHNKENGDHTVIRFHPPTSEKYWETTDLHEIKKMITKGDLPWIENCAEDCKKYKLKLWRDDGLPEYLMPFLQEKAELVSCKPYAEDNIYFIKRIVDVQSLPDSHELSILKNKNPYETASLEDK